MLNSEILQHSHAYTALIFVPRVKFSLFPPYWQKGFPPLQPHELSFHQVALLYRLHWCGSDCVKQATHMNRCGWDSIWTLPVPEEGSLQLSSFTAIWPLPLVSNKRQQASWKALRLGIQLPGWQKDTRVAYILDGGILQPSYWNSDALTYSRFAGEKSRSMALCMCNWPFNWESKSRALVTEPSLILHCYCLILFWKLTLKVSHIQMSAWTSYVLQNPAKWSCSWLCLYLSLGVVTFTATDKQSQIRRGISYQSLIFPWATLTVQ